jgi:hypothetical protein
MKNLKDIIIEKLVINKNTKVEPHIDYENSEDICNIYKAAFISIMKNSSYFENMSFKKTLSNIQYNDIIDILNDVFEYKNIDYDEGKIKKGNVWKIIHNDKKPIQNLVNGYTITFKYDRNIELSGTKLLREYKDIIKKK